MLFHEDRKDKETPCYANCVGRLVGAGFQSFQFPVKLNMKNTPCNCVLSKNRLALFFKYPKTHLNTYYWIIMFCFWNSRTMPNWMLPFPFRLSIRSLRVFYKALAGDGSKWLAQQNGASLVYTKQQRFSWVASCCLMLILVLPSLSHTRPIFWFFPKSLAKA